MSQSRSIVADEDPQLVLSGNADLLLAAVENLLQKVHVRSTA